MALPDHLIPVVENLTERERLVLEVCVGIDRATQNYSFDPTEAAQLATKLGRLLAIMKQALEDEKKARRLDNERAKTVIASYRRTIEEYTETLRRFGFSDEDLKKK